MHFDCKINMQIKESTSTHLFNQLRLASGVVVSGDKCGNAHVGAHQLC